MECFPPYAFDMWTVIHLVGWLVAAASVRKYTTWSALSVFCSLVGLGVGWELIEPYTVEIWFGFQEPWYNRVITDPLADALGTVLGLICVPRKGIAHDSR